MRKVLDFVGLLVVLQGVGGLIHHFFEGFRVWTLVSRQDFVAGYEVPASIALLALGGLIWVLGEALLPNEKERAKRERGRSPGGEA